MLKASSHVSLRVLLSGSVRFQLDVGQVRTI